MARETFTAEDFETRGVKECQRFWGVSDEDMQYIRDSYVGKPVNVRKEDRLDGIRKLQAAGWKSWKQYQIHAAIRNF